MRLSGCPEARVAGYARGWFGEGGATMERLAAGDPRFIGEYRLLARLGAGGMGQVFLARSERGRTVAVKLVRADLAAREEFRARFRQEVAAARRVGGPWTAPVLDADTEAAVPWVATGYVAGPSLQQVVGHDHGALPERSVRILGAGLAHALKDIHAAGMVHRDLKPSNVLVTIDGPRVIDFGIARALLTDTGAGLTRTGALVGSPGFMAPEQVRGERVTPACDVFCLGSVLAYAATGVPPFGSADSGAPAQLFRIAHEDPDLTGVPEGIADLVRACLRKDPAARPSLDTVLARTGAEDTVAEGRSRDPWLPGALVAQLGRHAVRLLEVEDPETAELRTVTGPVAPGGGGGGVSPLPPAGAGRNPLPSVPSGNAGPPGTGNAGPPGAVNAGSPPPYGTPHAGAGPTPPPYGVPGAASPYGVPYGTPYGAPGPTPPPHGTSPYASSPYASAPQSPPPKAPAPPNRTPSTVLLLVIALVVALAAGASVYALMSGGGSGDGDGGRASDDPRPAPTAATSSASPAGSPAEETEAAKETGGALPAAYLGTWTTTVDNATGHHRRSLTLRQGEVGDTVLSLVADGDGYHCAFEAALTADPGTDGPLRFGPSTVTTGEPASACTPGSSSEVSLLPDGRLERVLADDGKALAFTRG
ncbi:hypothetical protein GCM10010240_54080 [Streptomyces griseoviridis]|nr:hypothetical protein GCM10010240_54080 [Streptomyces griseoviridis]